MNENVAMWRPGGSGVAYTYIEDIEACRFLSNQETVFSDFCFYFLLEADEDGANVGFKGFRVGDNLDFLAGGGAEEDSVGRFAFRVREVGLEECRG